MQAARSLNLLSILVFLFSCSIAWPWPPSDADLVKRQDDGSESRSVAPPRTSEPDAESRTASVTGSSRSATITAEPTSSDEEDESSSSERSAPTSGRNRNDSPPAGTRVSNSTVTRIDPRLPAGGVQMITPAPLSGPQYYKIGDYVTFGWNYTSLSVTPSAIDIMASCSLNNHIYTIAANQSVGESGVVTWDTGAEATATVPLLMATYTLLIYDSNKGITAAPSPGYLGLYNLFTFGMYNGKKYTELPPNQCVSCSGAMGSMERQALSFMFGMAAVTVFSFTWFARGFGVF